MIGQKFLFALTSTVMLLAILSGCSSLGGSAPTPTPDLSQPVQTGVDVILAEAKVIPISDTSLGFSTVGIIDQVLVGEGDAVKKDQVIARLKGNDRLMANVSSAEVALLNAKQNLDNLYKNHALAKSNAELALAQAKIDYQDALDDRTNKNYRRSSDATLDGIRADYILAVKALEDAQDFYDAVKDRAEDDEIRAAALSALSRATKARDRALQNLNYALGYPDADEVAKADAKVSLAKARVDDAQRKYDDLAKGPNPDDIALAEGQVKQAEDALKAAKIALDDLELKSPIDGIIVSSNLKKGEYASPGVIEVVIADLSEMEIETTDLTELNIVNVKVGDKAKSTVDAIPGLELTGTVKQIKPLGENKQGDIVYTVIIKLDQQDPRLLWNMNAQVTFEKE